MGTARFSPGLKRLGTEADHSRPVSAKVKNKWSYNSTLSVWLHGVYTDNFTPSTVYSLYRLLCD
jgi:hypothetical protein